MVSCTWQSFFVFQHLEFIPCVQVMSRPSSVIPQADKSSDNEDTEKRKEAPVAIDGTRNTDAGGEGKALEFLSSITKHEPVVTRRELWSYYCQSSFFASYLLLSPYLPFFKVYSNGDNVCIQIYPVFQIMYSKFVQFKGVGPNTYSLTLLQSLATAAGYDPVLGPGSSCNTSDASGQCVVPWSGGTQAVSSVVLIANGASFAVSFHPYSDFISISHIPRS